MQSKYLALAVRSAAMVLLIAGTAVLAQDRKLVHFSGLINDYTPATVKGGPWEMHGQWTMDILWQGQDNGPFIANFYADMTMSDYGTTAGAADMSMGGQSPHTHHIRLMNRPVTVTTDGCPTVSPATTRGFQINGPVNLITGNGSNAPFEPTPPVSTLQVCVTGGTEVAFSNVTLVFGAPANTHFGTQAIHGVVRTASLEPSR